MTLVVPFGAGGNSDAQARLLADRLERKLKRPFVVQNKSGGIGAIAVASVLNSPPDGYTLLFAASPQISSIPKIETVSYKVSDLRPVSAFGIAPMILGIKSSLPAKNLDEFVEYVKKNPGKLTYASAGRGSNTHLVAALLAKRAGLQMLRVPYRDGLSMIPDLMAGSIDMYFGDASWMLGYGQNGQMRLIGVSTAKRMEQLPNVPAIDESYPGFEFYTWNGVVAPAAAPNAVVETIAREVRAVARDPEVVQKLLILGITALGNTPAEFEEMIEKDEPMYDEAIAAAGLK